MDFEIQGVIFSYSVVDAVGPLEEETDDGKTHFVWLKSLVGRAARVLYCSEAEAQPVMAHFRVRTRKKRLEERLATTASLLRKDLAGFEKFREDARKADAQGQAALQSYIARVRQGELLPPQGINRTTQEERVKEAEAAMQAAIDNLEAAIANLERVGLFFNHVHF